MYAMFSVYTLENNLFWHVHLYQNQLLYCDRLGQYQKNSIHKTKRATL